MATDVILPALGMSQDTGKIVQWLKAEGEHVAKGTPLVEIETDKATVEIESPVAGVLARVSASEGDDVPVGQVIAVILDPDEVPSRELTKSVSPQTEAVVHPQRLPLPASPLASRIATEHNVDVSLIPATGRRVQKADVLTYLQEQNKTAPAKTSARLVMASPKARRLASEQGKDLGVMQGTGPGGAVLAADVLAAVVPVLEVPQISQVGVMNYAPTDNGANESVPGHIWRIMAERTTQSWTTVPHFYLMREVNASRLIAWREQVLALPLPANKKRSTEKVTYTDLLVKIVAAALRLHPRLNASWSDGKITLQREVHMGLAVAVAGSGDGAGEGGLVVPVIHVADTLSLSELVRRRVELVAKAQAGKLRPEDISGGTFTISNLGMYNVDAFNAIINAPQAAILAVGRIAERVVPVNGQPAVQPMMVLTLSCDHRAVDGARGAQFLDTVASLIEEPLGLLG